MDNKTFSVYKLKRNDHTSREKDTILQVIQYVQARMGHGSQTPSKESQQETEGLYAILQKTLKGSKEMTKTFKELRKGYHRMPDGTIMKDSEHTKEEDELQEVTPAQRRARKQAYLIKTMKKYGDAAKMGIPASQVNQRRNAVTRKKT